MTTKQIQLTAIQRADITEILHSTKTSIEAEQEAPLDLDQACTIHSICEAFSIAPLAVLDEALNLIEPGKPAAPPLLELLDRKPEILDELGRAL